MKHLLPQLSLEQERQFYSIHRGMMNGCELYLSEHNRMALQAGTYEREIHRHLSRISEGARVFLDIGAAEGFFSIFMLRNSEAKVFAFETEDDFGEVLFRNLERNTRDGHRISHSDEPLTGELTINTVVGIREGPVIVKIDTEGDEPEILQGASDVLSRPDTRVMLRVHDKPTEARCLHMLDAHEFDTTIVGPAWWRSLTRDLKKETRGRWLIAEKSGVDGLCS